VPASRAPVADYIELGTFPAVQQAATWGALYDALWSRASNANGTAQARSGWSGDPKRAPAGVVISGTVAPRLTNEEAAQLVRGFHEVARSFPLWDQYAAVAYGWDPPDRDALDASAPRASRSYNTEVGVALWLALNRVCADLDAAKVEPSLKLAGDFADATFLTEVQDVLKADGAEATFKIPTGACIDKKTGARRMPRPPCGKDGKLKDPFTGVEIQCDTAESCPPEFIDDPITHAIKSLWPLALMVGALWLITRDSKPTRRARRYRD
jgi:hypothetical protein